MGVQCAHGPEDPHRQPLTGDERVRHCARCRLSVFNVKEMTETEVNALFLKTEGRVCGQIYERADGTVLTKDCPTGLAAVRRKVLGALTMTAAMLLAMIGYGWANGTLGPRVVEARESLRGTWALGPLIEKLYPAGDLLKGKTIIAPWKGKALRGEMKRVEAEYPQGY